MTRSPTLRPLRKVLIANRGEIAVRILRGLRESGIRSAVVYSDADRDALPVQLADEAHRIGPAPSAESYLRAEAIVDLAVRIGADAIHPGYGFLSENADFARLCRDRGVIFIGPPPEAIAAMGSKIEARRRMIDADVPVVPGGRDPLTSLEAAAAAAETIGYPVMLKASAGGGGKGMRMVETPDALAAAFRGARGEAAAAFGDDAVYLEKFIVEPRHIEIQILGDHHGRVVSLGERECSLQRRHQKVLEEAPSPIVDAELRRHMGAAAVRAAEAVGYTNAGTCEFLVDRDRNFYFLEMNTRLQVEHPVTELVSGVDLVREQLRIAAGEPLGPRYDAPIEPHGHAIEVRLYAEDPWRNFAPSPGRIVRFVLPDGPGVRCDCGVAEGGEVSIHYDPMIAKLIVWGTDRLHALDRLGRALDELRVDGIRTGVPLFRQMLADDDVRAGRLDISMLDRKLADGTWGPTRADADASAVEDADVDAPPDLARDLAIVAAAVVHAARRTGPAVAPSTAPGGLRSGWRSAGRREALQGGQPWIW